MPAKGQKMSAEAREKNAKYKKDHAEEIKAKNAKYWKEHVEGKKAYDAKYRNEHVEERKAYGAKYWRERQEEIRKYRKEHADVIKARDRKYKKEHAVEIREKNAKYRKEHAEERKVSDAKYKKTPEYKSNVARKRHKRRARGKQVENTLTSAQWNKILKHQKGRCAMCNRKFSSRLFATRDHIVPLSKGGGLTYENVQALCRTCNSKKSDELDTTKIVTWLHQPIVDILLVVEGN
jgi:5-methylcytosine-specific restriction endonuclease McrA